MSEMIELVAREIATAQLSRQYIGKLKNIGAVIEIDRIWPEFVPEAKAAIKIMRDLTDEMDMAGSEALPAPDGHSMPDDFRDAWHAAFDIALKAE